MTRPDPHAPHGPHAPGAPPAARRAAPAGGVNLPALRSHNAALVLDLLRGAGEAGISRIELAEGAGLTPQAVSKIVARLRAEGMAAEAGRRASTGGKPRTVLRLVPSAGYAVGLHLDRDELTAVLLDLAGTRVATHRAPLDLGAPAATVVAAAATQVEALLARAAPPGAEPPGVGGSAASRPPGTHRAEPPGRTAPVGPSTASAAGSPGPTAPTTPAGSAAGSPRRAVPAAPATARTSEGAPAPAADLPAPAPPAPVADPPVPGGPAPWPRVLGAGVAMPGPLDHARGVPHRVTGHPHWDGYPLRDALAGRLGLPVVLDKDTNAAALGLALRGPGDSFAYLHLGTGLGAGLVLGGALHRGARTGAGEFGHQVLQLDGPVCDCGERGCVEVLCLAAVARGDVAEAARVLGTAAGNLVGLLDIDRVLLGGRVVAAAEEVFVRGVAEVVARRGPVPVAPAPGGPHTVAEGAAQLVLAPVFGRAPAAPAADPAG
ncbi:ROK family protein [Streptomyces zhihengii]|uniref:ROK family transcriptional regulator n=1 Tax=Streptomyces zhihengii TaxID=1818004 RepID=UPI0034557FFB